MRVVDVLFTKSRTGFFFDDKLAIQGGLAQDGFVYVGQPSTAGFSTVRQAGEAISIMFVLDDGFVALGDCAAVQYSGAAGRDPLLLADSYIPFLQERVAPLICGRKLTSFRDMAREFDELCIDGQRLHTAIRYGLSQAILNSIAHAEKLLGAEVVAREYGLELVAEPIPVLAQSGDDRYVCADKMILKGVDVLPHALINVVEGKLGRSGEDLLRYVGWLRDRVFAIRPRDDYKPSLHVDCYGTIAHIFGKDWAAMATYLGKLEQQAAPFQLYVEAPMDMGGRSAQIEALASLKAELEHQHIRVRIVADEWCNTLEDVIAFTDAACCHMLQVKTPDLGSLHNTVEAVLYCREHGMGAYQGGTCNETDISSRACVQVAMGARPELIMAKPGMGFDEGYMIVRNEMERCLALLRRGRKN